MNTIVNFLLAGFLLCFLAECKKKEENSPKSYVCNVDPIICNDSTTSTFIFVATAFTPNGDGRNDFLRANMQGDTAGFLLAVYTENDEKIFETSDVNGRWDGKYQDGSNAPEGNYRVLLRWHTHNSLGSEIITNAGLCTHLFRPTSSGCVNTGNYTYYFEDQLNPGTGKIAYQTGEKICP